MIRTPLMNVITAAVLKAGRSLRRDFADIASLKASKKGPGDFVSLADKRAEEILHMELEKARPDYCFLMEESGKVEGTDKTHVWHIDPLDGTTNFLHGLPLFAISVALQREGQMVAGAVYNPITDDLYIAERGQGAFHNNRRMRVSSCIDATDALIACGIPHIGKSGGPAFIKEMAQIMPRVGGIRRLGAASLDLAAVANGQFEAFWERGLNSWDIGAGIVLVREAGGFVTDLKGADEMLDSGNVLAGNEALHRILLDILKRVD